MADQHPAYHPRDALHNTGSVMFQTTIVGAVVAGVQNTLRKQNVGAMGILTRSGGVIALFAGAGGAYQFTLDATANMQQKDDCYNEFYAGFAAGAVAGIMRRSLPFMLGAGAVFGTGMTAYRYTAGMRGTVSGEVDDEEVERREAMKKLRRRPLSETIEQLGEGRGIYAPGYEERRRQRILEKYGIDVKAAQA
ncbi:NADH-ubiquinone oxidoreductase 213 kDa subunit [Didymella exigua CBS 183.55]|uniref:NADH-ubiquinone oxidoreductase 213 kDa subunit n=1 Tax=Didymella exigua CBS 183.55 TaxID=1150837 RepID=A0A6A5RRX4_9PLEO|nr:NADH-ubiquinone oxidoreductase 213 kDa subunit [Didymella exigua CBS 183.55]KAF1929046.1 NADH-ubiquinone oxidoreductase 213 kDa subunit [Didymella exigua CBS 183.55]